MKNSLAAPSHAIADLIELDLFFEVWRQALGPSSSPTANGTGQWLYDFGTQTKWLTGDTWNWWLERFRPPGDIDISEAQNFIALVIGMLGNRNSPQGEAVRYARRMSTYLEKLSESGA